MTRSKIKEIEILVGDTNSLKVSEGLEKTARYNLAVVQVEKRGEIKTRLEEARRRALDKLGVKLT